MFARPRSTFLRRLPSAVLALAIAFAASAPAAAQAAAQASRDSSSDPIVLPAPVAREFRGAWLVTVGNGDWPSRPGLSTWQQQQELLDLLNRAQQLGLNAIILQVRPGADALYASKLEPWSHYLTGRQGRAPEPFWDPLAFAVKAAHERGMELHAWFNPFRVVVPRDAYGAARTNVVRTHPDLVRRYGSYHWMDPGLPAARERAIRAILDVVRRYDIDGVHIDDYFYPYKENGPDGRPLAFPDAGTYRRYRRQGGRLDRDDWRRRNIDLFVQEYYRAVKRTKKWVKVGISPFGIWRPGYPAVVRGMDAYDEIYADSRRWLREGWLDYLVPQLYWRADAPQQPYVPLLQWWIDQDVRHRHVWPGLYTGHVGMTGNAKWPADEIVREIALTRGLDGATGHVHFPMNVFLQDPDALDARLADAYAHPALVPASPWLDSVPPKRPRVVVARDSASGDRLLRLTPREGKAVFRWAVRARVGDGWTTELLPGRDRVHRLLDADSAADVIYVTAIDRLGNESAGALVSTSGKAHLRVHKETGDEEVESDDAPKKKPAAKAKPKSRKRPRG